MENWSEDIITFLELIRKKCVELSKHHTSNFFYYKTCVNYFDVPIIIFSVFSSFISVGVSDFVEQKTVSITTAGISMITTILCSIKLYLNLTSNTASELEISKEFYILALDISKMLFVPVEHRAIDQITFLNTIYNSYIVLLEKSSLIKAEEEQNNLAGQVEKLKTSPKSPFSLQSRLKNPLLVNTIA